MTVIVCDDPDDLAATVAHQLRSSISQLQVDPERIVQLCLTGGRIAERVYQRLADGQEANTVDWKRVEFWWGDERFVATESPDRNAGGTLATLAATINLDPARVHPMPAAAGEHADLDRAAVEYANELGETRFDICLLGMGEDGHVASIFPDHPSFEKARHGRVIAVTDSPKPPPERISLTLPAINDSAEVWLIISGEQKARMAARAQQHDRDLPAGNIDGRLRTVWFLDTEAAGR